MARVLQCVSTGTGFVSVSQSLQNVFVTTRIYNIPLDDECGHRHSSLQTDPVTQGIPLNAEGVCMSAP